MELNNIHINSFSQQFDATQQEAIETKLKSLDLQTPLLPLRQEIKEHIDELIKILEVDIEWFILSKIDKDPEKKKFANHAWEFYDKRANLIVNELEDLL